MTSRASWVSVLLCRNVRSLLRPRTFIRTTLGSSWQVILLVWPVSCRLIILFSIFFFEIIHFVVRLIITHILRIINFFLLLRLARLIWLSPDVYLFIWRYLFLKTLWNTSIIAWLLRWTRRDGINWWLDIFWIDIDWGTNLGMWLIWWSSHSVIIYHWRGFILIAWFWRLAIFTVSNFARYDVFI